MKNIINKFIKKIMKRWNTYKLQKAYKKKIEELKKRDPFVYRH